MRVNEADRSGEKVATSISGIPVVSVGNEQICFEEDEIRQVCRIMRCGTMVEECIGLMRKRSMECRLCYAMMNIFKKPFKILRAGRHGKFVPMDLSVSARARNPEVSHQEVGNARNG
jgi:hypothetical protein